VKVLVGCEFSGVVRDAFAARGHEAWSCDILPTERPGQQHVTSRRGNRTAIFGEARRREMKIAAAFFNDLFRAPIHRICIENPIPHKYAREIIGPYTQLIQPWMFGHGETKATCFWLKNLPPLQPTHLEGDLFCEEAPTERRPRVHLESPSADRWKKRSRTFEGIANAMAEQWQYEAIDRQSLEVAP
jgi:hypothetical protein